MTGPFHFLVSGMVLVLTLRQGHYKQNLLWRERGRVVSTPTPELTQALPCVLASPCPPLGTDSPSLAAASPGPSQPLNHHERPWNGFCPHCLAAQGLLSCFLYSESKESSQRAICDFHGTQRSQGQVPSASTGLAGKSSLSPDIWK